MKPQREYVDYVRDITTLQALPESMLHQLMTGQLRVGTLPVGCPA